MLSYLKQLSTKFENVSVQQVRFARHKPWIPKYRTLRQMQPFDPPTDIQGIIKNVGQTPADERNFLKRNGLLTAHIPKNMLSVLSCSDAVFDPYKIPEEDGKTSIKGKVEGYYDYAKALMQVKRHDTKFDKRAFPEEAERIYLEAHNLLVDYKQNELRLLELVTDKAFSKMTSGLDFRTTIWKFVASLEPPKLVHLAAQQLMSSENVFAQATIRFHTQQVFAMYDRFGRILYGHPTAAVDVLEYVVFEKFITDEYGAWRIHEKLSLPDSARKHRLKLPSNNLEDINNLLADNKLTLEQSTSMVLRSRRNIDN